MATPTIYPTVPDLSFIQFRTFQKHALLLLVVIVIAGFVAVYSILWCVLQYYGRKEAVQNKKKEVMKKDENPDGTRRSPVESVHLVDSTSLQDIM